jgi:integrase
MASLSRDKNGTSRIQFIDGAGERRAVRLGKVPVKVGETVLRRIEALAAHAIAGTAHDADLSAWLASVPAVLYRRLVRVGLVAPRAEDRATDTVTVEQLCVAFKDRAGVKPGTAAAYSQTLDSLRAFYGPTKPITEITTASADLWRKAIATATEGEGKRKKRRTTVDGRLAPATVAKRVHVAKQVFGKAVAWGWLGKNPFTALRAGSQANPARAAYVAPETLEAVLEACPGVQWRLVLALPRLAGLRCPSEVGGLAWSDVDFANGRLTVRSPKTEHHGGGHAVRLVPIVPRLREILADAFDAAPTGERLVVPMAGRPGANLRTTAEKIIARASVAPWPRLFQNLRASCETDWVQAYPAHVAAKWLGHSPTIAAQHYLQVRDANFRDAIDGAAAGRSQSGAECGARAAHFQAQHDPARDRRIPQTRSQADATAGLVRSGAEPCKTLHKCLVGNTGFELPADSPGGIEIGMAGGAESGALRPEAEAETADGLDPALALVMRRWASLTSDQRLAILEIITAGVALDSGALSVARG